MVYIQSFGLLHARYHKTSPAPQTHQFHPILKACLGQRRQKPYPVQRHIPVLRPYNKVLPGLIR